MKVTLLPQAKQDLDAIYDPVLGRIIRVLPRGAVEIAYIRHCRRAPPA